MWPQGGAAGSIARAELLDGDPTLSNWSAAVPARSQSMGLRQTPAARELAMGDSAGCGRPAPRCCSARSAIRTVIPVPSVVGSDGRRRAVGNFRDPSRAVCGPGLFPGPFFHIHAFRKRPSFASWTGQVQLSDGHWYLAVGSDDGNMTGHGSGIVADGVAALRLFRAADDRSASSAQCRLVIRPSLHRLLTVCDRFLAQVQPQLSPVIRPLPSSSPSAAGC